MVTVVTPQVNDCDEVWIDPEAFALEREIDVCDAIDLIREATIAVWTLTGERFHGAQCWSERYRLRRGQRYLRLRQWPVDEVISVSFYNACSGVRRPLDVCERGNGLICLPKNGLCDAWIASCACEEPQIIVEYSTKSNLPLGAPRAVGRVADEFYKQSTGQPCSLPERITSVNRQGVSWSIADIQAYVEKGTTGIDAVDHWITRINGPLNAALIDTQTAGVLIESRNIGCGGNCVSEFESEFGS